MPETPNTVELLDIAGSDESHGLSAWTSRRRDVEKAKWDRLSSLLKEQMMNHDTEHTSPFEKSYIQFLVTSDVATHIHIIKHRIGVSVNAESARYKELKDDRYYIPEDWPHNLKVDLIRSVERAQEEYHEFVERLMKAGFSRSRAKESARFVRPYASSMTQDVSFNFLSLMRFLHLRNDEHAQLEVRKVARTMLQLVRASGRFPISLEAFGWYEDEKIPMQSPKARLKEIRAVLTELVDMGEIQSSQVEEWLAKTAPRG